MSDYGDESRKVVQAGLDRSIAKTTEAARRIDPGKPGDCYGCGEYFERVVTRRGKDYCGRCRDKNGLG